MAKTVEASNGTKAGKTATGGLRPLGSNVLVQRDKAGDRTESGLYLPEKAKETPRIGTIVAAGTGRTNHKTGDLIPLSISKGDRVLFSSYSGTEVKIDGEEYLVMTESEILAVIED